MALPALRRLACLATALAWTACLPSPGILEAVVPDETRSAAQALMADIRAGDVASIRDAFHPEVDAAQMSAGLAPLVEAASSSAAFATRFGSWRWVQSGGVGRHEIAYEIALDDRFVVLLMAFTHHDGALGLSGARFQETDVSPIERHRFALEGKGPLHYGFVAAGLAMPVTCLATAVACWRRRPRRRWLWLLFIVVAFPLVELDWTNGALSFQPFSVNLLGAGFSQPGPLQPATVRLGLPVGALVFLLVRPPRRPEPGDVPPPPAPPL